MADKRQTHLQPRLEALRHLAAAGPQTAYALGRRLGVSSGLARQRLKYMEGKGLVEARRAAGGATEYLPSPEGTALLRASVPELPTGAAAVLILEPVVASVRSALWRQIIQRPPLWLVRTRGSVSWMVICRSAAEADELADILNAAGDPQRAACLAVLVEGTALEPMEAEQA